MNEPLAGQPLPLPINVRAQLACSSLLPLARARWHLWRDLSQTKAQTAFCIEPSSSQVEKGALIEESAMRGAWLSSRAMSLWGQFVELVNGREPTQTDEIRARSRSARRLRLLLRNDCAARGRPLLAGGPTSFLTLCLCDCVTQCASPSLWEMARAPRGPLPASLETESPREFAGQQGRCCPSNRDCLSIRLSLLCSFGAHCRLGMGRSRIRDLWAPASRDAGRQDKRHQEISSAWTEAGPKSIQSCLSLEIDHGHLQL